MKKSIALIFCLLAASCAKKQDTVVDLSPDFTVNTPGLSSDATTPITANLKRDETSVGPLVPVEVGADKVKLAYVDKEIVCGNFAPILGTRRQATDPQAYLFQINDDEFKGLKTLPMKSQCQLVITTVDTETSRRIKKFNLLVNYDKPQPINAVIEPLSPGLVQVSDPLANLMMARLTIVNEYTYNLRLRIQRTFSMTMAPCDSVMFPAVARSSVLCSDTLHTMTAEDLIFSDYNLIASRDASGTTEVVLKPNDRIVVSFMTVLPQQFSEPLNAPGAIYNNLAKSFAGILVTKTQSGPILAVTQELESASYQYLPVMPLEKPIASTPYDYLRTNHLP